MTTRSNSLNGNEASTDLLSLSFDHQSLILRKSSFKSSGEYFVQSEIAESTTRALTRLLIPVAFCTFFFASEVIGEAMTRFSTVLNSSGMCVASAPTSTTFAMGPSEAKASNAACPGDASCVLKTRCRRRGVGVAKGELARAFGVAGAGAGVGGGGGGSGRPRR